MLIATAGRGLTEGNRQAASNLLAVRGGRLGTWGLGGERRRGESIWGAGPICVMFIHVRPVEGCIPEEGTGHVICMERHAALLANKAATPLQWAAVGIGQFAGSRGALPWFSRSSPPPLPRVPLLSPRRSHLSMASERARGVVLRGHAIHATGRVGDWRRNRLPCLARARLSSRWRPLHRAGPTSRWLPTS